VGWWYNVKGDNVDVKISDQGAPFVISFRRILKTPKITRSRQFVGLANFVKNCLVKAIEFVEKNAFETKTEVIDPGKSVVVHWAVNIRDPWETQTGEADLVAFRMDGDKPPCGAHFEVITAEKRAAPPAPAHAEEGEAETEGHPYRRRSVQPIVGDDDLRAPAGEEA